MGAVTEGTATKTTFRQHKYYAWEAQMNILVNGESRNIEPGTSVLGLLGVLEIEPRKVAVERNLEIVPKSAYPTTILAENDRLEIVQFVGGG